VKRASLKVVKELIRREIWRAAKHRRKAEEDGCKTSAIRENSRQNAMIDALVLLEGRKFTVAELREMEISYPRSRETAEYERKMNEPD